MKSIGMIPAAVMWVFYLAISPGVLSGQAEQAPPRSAIWPAAAAPMVDHVLSIDELERNSGIRTAWRPNRVNLAPAQWIWLPSQRTLPNTFLLFRRQVAIEAPLLKATGWITADSRYLLTVNGKRAQWGPAPCDPRHLDVAPTDITALLQPGINVIGVEVLFYGQGDGTWAAGKPGLILHLTLDYTDGRRERIVSDSSWQVRLDRAHRPGQYKRWFLRALQEDFDARLHPQQWDTAAYRPDDGWVKPMVLSCPPDKPAACSNYPGNDLLDRADPAQSDLCLREIPLMREMEVPVKAMVESGVVQWQRDPNDWFDLRMPDCFRIQRQPVAVEKGPGIWHLPAASDGRSGQFLLFEFPREIVGWPYFTIEAPPGTIVELMCQEAHDRKNPAWLDSGFFGWSRFTCREGVNRFQTFDFEALRWLQLHIRNATGPVTISQVGVRRRVFDWPNAPHIRCAEPALQQLFDATINTLYNSAQETCVDGMARERQQYSGDGSHQLHAIRIGLGEPRLPQRFLRTFSQGLTKEGYFLDCWPAFDRLSRVMQREVDGAFWGPLLDHGVGFNFDCWHHYLQTGDLAALDEAYPRLLRFADYLHALRGPDGLLPVEGLGIPNVWIDHSAFRQQRHKQCAFNLYAAAMLEQALSPIARARGDGAKADEFQRRGRDLLACAVRRFWDPQRQIFVNNLPWLADEKAPRLDDRSLATSILFDQCPKGNRAAALQALVECPPEMGLSYPCNACWRYWALARLGRCDVVITDLRNRWATMPSVILNHTLQEDWTAPPDSTAQWSHCAVAPVNLLFMDIAGIRPTAPGFARCDIRPQLGDLGDLELAYHTPRGPILFAARKQAAGHRISITLPIGCDAELLLNPGQKAALPTLAPDHPLGLKRFRLQAGKENIFAVR